MRIRKRFFTMEVDVNKQALTINKLVCTKNKNITIEGDVIVPDVKPDILNAIDSVGNVCIYKKEILEGKIRFDGGINLYLIYLPDSETETTRALNTTLDFSQIVEMDNCKPNMDVIAFTKINNIECRHAYKCKRSVNHLILLSGLVDEQINTFEIVDVYKPLCSHL